MILEQAELQLDLLIGPNRGGRWRGQPRTKRAAHPVASITAANALPALADMTCDACGVSGVAVLAIEQDAGAAVHGWCGIACAKTAGWPWLESRP